jgi:hypothetical protein
MRLPLAHQALARAQRMLDDLGQHVEDEVAFRDRLPYVLDLLAGVTRCVDSGSKGSRTQQFADWWSTTDRTMQTSIQELRNAELKRVESRSQPQVKVEMIPPDPQPVSSGDLHELIASQFSIVVSTEWRFIGGDLDGKPVLPALVQYWNDVSGILAKAEVLLGP